MKVLVVDDDGSSRMILKRILARSFDCTVIEAEDGEQALKMFAEEKPEVVLLDLMLPDMNGHTVLERIRELTGDEEVCVICVSAVRDREPIRYLISLGVRDYLLKPLNFEQARQRLARVLGDLKLRPPRAAGRSA